MSQKDTVNKLLEIYGPTFSEEIGIDLEKETPSVLFQWLCCSNLFSARIGYDIAVNAGKAIINEGWTTAENMDKSSWSQRVNVLNNAHYTRYQEKTSTFLGDLSESLLEKYNGDLRKLHEKAEGDVKKLRSLLKEFKGLGDFGVDIFLREVQLVWKELYPFVDDNASSAAKKLNLPKTPDAISKLVSKKDLPKLLAALVRADLNRDYELKGEAAEDNFEEATKEELYREAKKKNIKGRSKMTKSELRQALED